MPIRKADTISKNSKLGVRIGADVEKMKRLRMQRFGMAIATYVFVIFATALLTRFGLGKMSSVQWAVFIGIALAGNFIFFILFYTGINLRFSDPSLTREQIVYSAFCCMVILYALPEARPIALMFYLPAFSFGMLRLNRRQYFWLIACVLGLYAALLGWEYLYDPRKFNIQYQLFLFVLFGILLMWYGFFGGFVSNLRRYLRLQKEEIQKAHEEIKIENEERKRAQMEKDHLIVELNHALSKVRTLGGLLPICSSCKKIRDDQGYWNQIESYIKTHSDTEFTHSICPDCIKKLYPDLNPTT